MKVFQQNRYHASLAKKKIFPYKFGSVKTVSLHSSFFAKYCVCLSDVSSEVTGLYFEKRNIYEDILPRSDLNPTNGRFSCIECAKLCADQMSCQTFFHKPAKMISYLYNYPLMEYTETFPESGIKVYKMKGMYLI